MAADQKATITDNVILAFTNTIHDTGKTRLEDSFSDGEDLMRQLREAGLPRPAQPVGQGQLRSLRAFREATYAVLSARAAGRTPAHEDALLVQMAIKSAMADARLDFSAPRAVWRSGPLGGVQDALALRLAAFFASDRMTRLRECRRCTRLFLDYGRGPGRRWCSMETCGNREKVASFRARRREAQ